MKTRGVLCQTDLSIPDHYSVLILQLSFVDTEL